MAAAITILAVGRIGRGPEAQLCADYAKRLAWPAETIEIDDRKAPRRGRQAWEAERILAHCPKNALLVALDERGATLDSAGFAALLGEVRDSGRPAVFAIGGPDGFDQSVRARADRVLAFGAMTWPHKLVRVMLAEQIYRAFTILTGRPYHRD